MINGKTHPIARPLSPGRSIVVVVFASLSLSLARSPQAAFRDLLALLSSLCNRVSAAKLWLGGDGRGLVGVRYCRGGGCGNKAPASVREKETFVSISCSRAAARTVSVNDGGGSTLLSLEPRGSNDVDLL